MQNGQSAANPPQATTHGEHERGLARRGGLPRPFPTTSARTARTSTNLLLRRASPLVAVRLRSNGMDETRQDPLGLVTVARKIEAETHDLYFVGLSLKRAQHELRQAVNAELAALGTNISQVSVLREIALNPGISSADLARLAWLTPQTLGQLVIQMQERGLVKRRPGEGRKICHYLTKAGEKLLVAGMEKTREVDTHVLRDFSDEELEVLVDAFRTIERRAGASRARTKGFAPTVVDS
jgi:DNA-binding MarR family transcriptional regulator